MLKLTFTPIRDSFPQSRILYASNISSGNIIIGRNNLPEKCNSNNLLFSNRVVSRYHGVIFIKDGSVYIQDTQSSSGTFINGYRLNPPGCISSPFELLDGDELQLGETCIVDGVEYPKIIMKFNYVDIDIDSINPEMLVISSILNSEDCNTDPLITDKESIIIDKKAQTEFDDLWNSFKTKDSFDVLNNLVRNWDNDFASKDTNATFLAPALPIKNILTSTSMDKINDSL